MTRIVRAHHHYKRPPRKRKIVALDGPRKPRRSVVTLVDTLELKPAAAVSRRSVIITTNSPDMTPEEHKRRGDAADALFRDMVRAAGKK